MDLALPTLLARGPVTWLLAGDSITSGWGLADYRDSYAGRFTAHLAGAAGSVRAQDRVANSGVPGATVWDALRDFEWRVTRHRADVVTVLFGMNDAGWGIGGLDRFEAGLAEFVSDVSEAGATVVLQTTYPVGPEGEGTHEALPAYNEAVRNLAARTDRVLVDHERHWAGLEVPESWYLDPYHLTESGHAELARLLVRTLLGPGEGDAAVVS
ncbi:SGNH/GDSL hydrolase family protein [Granulicoccus sp. GXG6511]|uniref:SGNH/GDSL hydrolase family protein n=1 Tax=Granulicoccus sp. GXG6511 TaxID=3381351 RepID=UPI003D7D1549